MEEELHPGSSVWEASGIAGSSEEEERTPSPSLSNVSTSHKIATFLRRSFQTWNAPLPSPTSSTTSTTVNPHTIHIQPLATSCSSPPSPRLSLRQRLQRTASLASSQFKSLNLNTSTGSVASSARAKLLRLRSLLQKEGYSQESREDGSNLDLPGEVTCPSEDGVLTSAWTETGSTSGEKEAAGDVLDTGPSLVVTGALGETSSQCPASTGSGHTPLSASPRSASPASQPETEEEAGEESSSASVLIRVKKASEEDGQDASTVVSVKDLTEVRSEVETMSNKVEENGEPLVKRSLLQEEEEMSVARPHRPEDNDSVFLPGSELERRNEESPARKRSLLSLQLPEGAGTQNANRKSPVTVQEWVASLPALPRTEDEGEDVPLEPAEDTLGLGAEAGYFDDAHLDNTARAKAPMSVSGPVDVSTTTSPSSKPHLELPPRVSLAQLKQASVQSELSTATVVSATSSHSSLSSVESLLEARRGDAEEMLLDLGFGGGDDAEVARIPKRFLRPSQVKGVDFEHFLKYQQELGEMYDSGLCGYRGLTGPFGQRPSAIVARILEKICEKEHERRLLLHQLDSTRNAEPTNPSQSNSWRKKPPPEAGKKFSRVAKTVGFLSKVRTASLQRATSVLNPANREYLESQGKKSPEVKRRLVLGSKTFTIERDGDLVEIYSEKGEDLTPNNNTSVDSDVDKKPSHPHKLLHKESVLSFMSMSSESDSDVDDTREELEKLFGDKHRTVDVTQSESDLCNVKEGEPVAKPQRTFKRSKSLLLKYTLNKQLNLSLEEGRHEDDESEPANLQTEDESHKSEAKRGRGSLKRQHRVEEHSPERTISQANDQEVPRSESFEMEEIAGPEDELPDIQVTPAWEPEDETLCTLFRAASAQSDSSGFMDGENAENHASTEETNPLTPVPESVAISFESHEVPVALLLPHDCQDSSTGLRQSVSEETVVGGDLETGDNRSDALELAVVRVKDASAVDKHREVDDKKQRCLEVEAVGMALKAYEQELEQQEQLTGPWRQAVSRMVSNDTQKDFGCIDGIKKNIRDELQHMMMLLQNQARRHPVDWQHKAAGILSQMTALLRQQNHLCRELEQLTLQWADDKKDQSDSETQTDHALPAPEVPLALMSAEMVAEDPRQVEVDRVAAQVARNTITLLQGGSSGEEEREVLRELREGAARLQALRRNVD